MKRSAKVTLIGMSLAMAACRPDGPQQPFYPTRLACEAVRSDCRFSPSENAWHHRQSSTAGAALVASAAANNAAVVSANVASTAARAGFGATGRGVSVAA